MNASGPGYQQGGDGVNLSLVSQALEASGLALEIRDVAGARVFANSRGRQLFASDPANTPDREERSLDGRAMWVERRAFEFGGERRRISVAFEVDAQQQLQDELYQRAYFDPLTSLPNRDLCDRAVVDLANAGRSGEPFALAVVEIEKFTEINALYGEAAGDALLQRIAERIAQNLGPEDWLGRSGGDEFCLILPDRAERA